MLPYFESIIVHIIFIASFLSRNARLVATPKLRKRDSIEGRIILSFNISDEIQRMQKTMAHFDQWRVWTKSQKDISKEQCGVVTLFFNNHTWIYGDLNLCIPILCRGNFRVPIRTIFCSFPPQIFKYFGINILGSQCNRQGHF